MPKRIFINLPVTDLPAAKRFYGAVGFTNNPRFTNDMAAAMVWSDEIMVMLMTHDFWKTFTSKALPDPHESALALLCLSHDSKEEVDTMLSNAVAAGARPAPTPDQDLSFMYGRSFEDPDGHIWENVWMDMASIEQGPPAEAMQG